MNFWGGIVIGFLLSIGFWFVTTKLLVPKMTFSDLIEEECDSEGRYLYQVWLANSGVRDAVDVTVNCALYSTGWSGDPPDLIATIAVPVNVQRINIVAANHPLRRRLKRTRSIDSLGRRKIILQLDRISQFQKDKLPTALQAELTKQKVALEDLMNLGTNSFVSMTVYAYDSFSGSRSVYTTTTYKFEGDRTAAHKTK